MDGFRRDQLLHTNRLLHLQRACCSVGQQQASYAHHMCINNGFSLHRTAESIP